MSILLILFVIFLAVCIFGMVEDWTGILLWLAAIVILFWLF